MYMVDKFKESLQFRLNVKYGMVNGLYWMIYCCTIAMASAFLIGRGFTTAGIGFLLGFIFLIATVLQQIVSAYADKSSRISVLDLLILFAGLLVISLLFLVACKNSKISTTFWFFLIGTNMTIMLPLTNALNFMLEKTNVKMNFGLCRSMGSLFFFFISLIVGKTMNDISTNSAPILGTICAIVYLLVLIWIRIDIKEFHIVQNNTEDPFLEKNEDSIFSIVTFKHLFENYKMFFVYLVGVIGFYFGHVLINNFFYQIVVNVGGNTADTGGILALQAIVELPAMMFFVKIKEHLSSRTLLSASAIFFFIKMLLTCIATNVGMLYVSVIFQAISFALFVPASVHFVDEIMNEKDAVKGQAFVTMAMTIANFLAAILGGLIINIAGTHLALIFGLIITLVGTCVSVFGLFRNN